MPALDRVTGSSGCRAAPSVRSKGRAAQPRRRGGLGQTSRQRPKHPKEGLPRAHRGRRGRQAVGERAGLRDGQQGPDVEPVRGADAAVLVSDGGDGDPRLGQRQGHPRPRVPNPWIATRRVGGRPPLVSAAARAAWARAWPARRWPTVRPLTSSSSTARRRRKSRSSSSWARATAPSRHQARPSSRPMDSTSCQVRPHREPLEEVGAQEPDEAAQRLALARCLRGTWIAPSGRAVSGALG